MGTAQIAAHQIGLQLWEFTALLLDSFAIAAQSLVGAALGRRGRRRRPGGWPGRWRAGARMPAWCSARCYAAGLGADPAAVQLVGRPCSIRRTCSGRGSSAMMPAAGLVFALDGVLIGAGDVAFLRTITVVAAVCAFAPINLAALHWHWGIGGVWAGLAAFILVRLVGMVARTRGDRWVAGGGHMSDAWSACEKACGDPTERARP